MNFKMFTFKSNFLLLIWILQGYSCQRRIQEGADVSKGKTYVVYFLKASVSPQRYSGWLCGGALISPSLIVTSAACVTDVAHLYAIAGYNKYITSDDIHKNSCTREKKKKVVLICTPNGYELSYNNPEKWTYIDIAVVKVESPYDFQDADFVQVCTYIPTAISINYDPKYQLPGIDAIVLGWGHTELYREEMDQKDYNNEMMQYAPTRIMDKTECKAGYQDFMGMSINIDKYMICTHSEGNLDDTGTIRKPPTPDAEGCNPSEQLRMDGQRGPSSNRKFQSTMDPECVIEKPEMEDDETIISRKVNNPANITINDTSSFVNTNNTFNSSVNNKMTSTAKKRRRSSTRRFGICQNDHGGPLVTWVGAHEVLIGVATAYKIDEDRKCIGPFLFTSTQCNGAFLSCIAKNAEGQITRRGDLCVNASQENGFNISETHISWMNHPDGPAENEKHVSKHAPTVNTNTNATSNLKNSNEGRNMQLQNNDSKILVNINISDTVENKRTTKVANVRASTAITTDSSNNVKESASVMLTSATSTNLTKTFANVKETDHSSSKSAKALSNSSKSNIDNATTTILMKYSSLNIRNTAKANISDILSANVFDTTNTDINATSNLKNFNEGKNMQLQNNDSTILANNIDTTDTVQNKTTTKVANDRASTAISTESSIVKESAPVMLTSAKSANLSKAFANLTETNHASSESVKDLSNSSKSNIDNTTTTMLMKNSSLNIGNTTTAKVLLIASLIENVHLGSTTNLVVTTPKSLENSTIQAYPNLTTSD